MYVTVNIDTCDVIGDIESDAMLAELKKRGVNDVPDPDDVIEGMQILAQAIHTGRPDADIVELARKACDLAGLNALPPPRRTT